MANDGLAVRLCYRIGGHAASFMPTQIASIWFKKGSLSKKKTNRLQCFRLQPIIVSIKNKRDRSQKIALHQHFSLFIIQQLLPRRNDATNFNSISHSSPIPLERYPDIKYSIGIRILHISENQMYYNENPVVVEFFSPNDRQ